VVSIECQNDAMVKTFATFALPPALLTGTTSFDEGVSSTSESSSQSVLRA